VSLSVRSDDLDADVLEITSRLNRLVEEQIREHPTAWTWSLKRFKSRPTRERAGHPVYSVHDP
jgi:lauroyl/myristoyl acyltransferase